MVHVFIGYVYKPSKQASRTVTFALCDIYALGDASSFASVTLVPQAAKFSPACIDKTT